MTIAEASPVQPPQPDEMFSPAYGAKLLFNSFRFSRGIGFTQHEIIGHFVSRNRDRFDLATIPEIIERTGEAATKYYMNAATHYDAPVAANFKDQEKAKWDAAKQVHLFGNSLRAKLEDEEYEVNPVTLTKALLESDQKWLPAWRHGRAPWMPHVTKPYSSNVLKYGFLDGKTGIKEFDDMYGEVVALMTDKMARHISHTGFIWRMGLVGLVEEHGKQQPQDQARLDHLWELDSRATKLVRGVQTGWNEVWGNLYEALDA